MFTCILCGPYSTIYASFTCRALLGSMMQCTNVVSVREVMAGVSQTCDPIITCTDLELAFFRTCNKVIFTLKSYDVSDLSQQEDS